MICFSLIIAGDCFPMFIFGKLVDLMEPIFDRSSGSGGWCNCRFLSTHGVFKENFLF